MMVIFQADVLTDFSKLNIFSLPFSATELCAVISREEALPAGPLRPDGEERRQRPQLARHGQEELRVGGDRQRRRQPSHG